MPYTLEVNGGKKMSEILIAYIVTLLAPLVFVGFIVWCCSRGDNND